MPLTLPQALVAVALVTALLPSPACASSPGRAEQLKKRADKAFLEGDFNAAIELLQKAYQADPQPGYLANQGIILIRLGEGQAAAERFEAYLQTNPPPDKAQMAAEHLGRYKPVVVFLTEPPGALVYLDGGQAPIGTAPHRAWLAPGRHEAELRLAGYRPTVARFTVERGQPTTIDLQLVPGEGTQVEEIGEGGGWSQRRWAWVALGGGLVAGAAGGFFLQQTLSEVEERDSAATGAAFDDHDANAHSFRTGYYVAAGLAVAGLSAGLYLLLTGDQAGDHGGEGDPGAEPEVAPGGLKFTF